MYSGKTEFLWNLELVCLLPKTFSMNFHHLSLLYFRLLSYFSLILSSLSSLSFYSILFYYPRPDKRAIMYPCILPRIIFLVYSYFFSFFFPSLTSLISSYRVYLVGEFFASSLSFRSIRFSRVRLVFRLLCSMCVAYAAYSRENWANPAFFKRRRKKNARGILLSR